jgi:hypothetical protein
VEVAVGGEGGRRQEGGEGNRWCASGGIIAGGGGGPIRGECGRVPEGVREQHPAWGTFRRGPFAEGVPCRFEFRIEPGFGGFPRFEFAGEGCLGDAVVGLRPFLDVEGGREESLERVIVPLGERLELVIVAFRALDRQAKEG